MCPKVYKREVRPAIRLERRTAKPRLIRAQYHIQSFNNLRENKTLSLCIHYGTPIPTLYTTFDFDNWENVHSLRLQSTVEPQRSNRQHEGALFQQ